MYRLILEHIIHLLLEEEYLALAKKSFKNRTDRTRLFVDKLKEGKPIDLTNGETVIIDKVEIGSKAFTKDNFEDLIDELPKLTKDSSIKFYSGSKVYNISAFAKTKELGGLGKGGSLGPERKVIASLQEQFKDIETPITLSIGGKSFPDIDGVVNVKENQKADFAFTSKGEPTVFISYKAGSGTKGIVSYGGFTAYADSDEPRRFIEAVKSRTTKMEKGGIEYAAPVRDSKVAAKVLFGSQSEEGSPGLNSVQAIVQGDDLKLMPTNGGYELKAHKIILAPNVPTDVEYAPFYNARYDDRSQFGVENSRFSLVPGGSRGNAKVININKSS